MKIRCKFTIFTRKHWKKIASVLFLCNLLSFVHADIFISEYVEGSSYNKALELYNPGAAPVDLGTGEYTLEVYFNGNLTPNMRIVLSGVINSLDVCVIAPTNIDRSVFPAAEVDLFYGTSWFNGDDAVVLKKGAEIIDCMGQVGFDPGSEWGTGDVSTMDNTLRRKSSVLTGNPDAAAPFDPRVEWDGYPNNTFSGIGYHLTTSSPFPTAAPALTPTPGPASPAPSASPCPTPALTASPAPGPSSSPAPAPVPIYKIQGAGHQSPYTGQTVASVGIVTLVEAAGFYLQDAEGDNDAATSDALYVYTGSKPGVKAGDRVVVAGMIAEYIPGGSSSHNLSITEFSRPGQITVTASGLALPAPVVLGTGGRSAPTEVIDNDNFLVFDPEEDGIDFFESLEGMRVSVPGARAVSPLNQYNEVYVVADSGYGATGLNQRGGITITDTDYNPERIQVQIDKSILPGFAPEIGTGDYLDNVEGVINYAFGTYELLAAQPFYVIPAAFPRETTSLVQDAEHLTVASFNLENLDPNSADGDDDAGSGRTAGLAAQIVNHLLCPDIIAVQEIQDNDGAADSGTVAADLTFAMLIEAIQAAGGVTYAWCSLDPENNSDGGQPGANIRVGFLYNPARVAFVAGSLIRITDPGFPATDAFADSRKSLRADFRFNGNTLTLINNHFASKGGSSPLFGAIQPYINGGEAQRSAQAAVINGYVRTLRKGNPQAAVLVMGDLNEFWFGAPLSVLEGPEQTLVNLTCLLDAAERYSYNFEGNSQELDHILATPNLYERASFDIVHLNAEYRQQYTDHDPVICSLFLPAPGVTDVKCFKIFRVMHKYNLLCWITAHEAYISGYNLYAAAAPGAEYIKINPVLITPCCVFPGGNKYYRFSERRLKHTPYRDYYLEAVDTGGNKQTVAGLTLE